MTTYKSYVGAEDINFWDGLTRTFTRSTSTGGSLTLNKVGAVVDILNVYGDGTAFTDVTISSAISHIGSNTAFLMLTPGTWTISDDVTIPVNLPLIISAGAVISVDSGKTLTINGDVKAGKYQIFSGSGSVAGMGAIEIVFPEWWGATRDGSTLDTAAINKALAIGGGIYFTKGTYLAAGDTLVGASNSHLIFEKGAVLKLDRTVSSKTLLSFVSKSNITLENPAFDLNQNGSVSDIALKLNASTNVVIKNPRIINTGVTRNWPTTAAYGYGVYLLGAWEDVKIHNIYAADIMYPVITEPSSTGNDLSVSKGRLEYLSGDGVEINVPTGSAENIEVEGLTLYKVGSNAATKGFGVGMSGGVGTTIKKVNVHDNKFIQCDFQGVHVEDGCERVNVHDNEFEDCGAGTGTSGFGAAVYVAATNATRLSKKVKIHDNSIKATTDCDYGIYAGGTQNTDDCEFTNNIIDMAGVGKGANIGSSFRRAKVNDNTVKNSSGPGMTISCPYSQVRGNICYDDDTSSQTYGIEYTSGAAYTIFAENILVGNATDAFLATSAPDGARFVNNIEAADQLVGFTVSSSVANTVGSYHFDGPISYKQRMTVDDAAYSVTRYDAYVAYTALSVGRQVTLPVVNLQNGHEVIIKDESGGAGTYNITIVPGSGTIDGVASVAISANYGTKRLRWNGTTWFTV